jgi:hypothetical protein
MADRNLLLIDQTLWVLSAHIGTGIYDFDFENFLPCTHPWQRLKNIQAIARIGAFEDYAEEHRRLIDEGINLVHDPQQHFLCSRLPNWYPLISDFTPRSKWYETIPSVAKIEADFHWPIFIKGERQTSRHKKSLSIITNPRQFEEAMQVYGQDPILRWQGIVCREYVLLRPVEESHQDRIPSSFEFRTFWWKGELVGCGRYWWEDRPYEMTATERNAAIAMASEAARRIKVPFLVLDIAQTNEGKWIVIECNDGQESGYAGVSPIGLWENIVTIEKRKQ